MMKKKRFSMKYDKWLELITDGTKYFTDHCKEVTKGTGVIGVVSVDDGTNTRVQAFSVMNGKTKHVSKVLEAGEVLMVKMKEQLLAQLEKEMIKDIPELKPMFDGMAETLNKMRSKENGKKK